MLSFSTGIQNVQNSGSGVFPPTLLDENRIPKFYHDAIALCEANSGGYLDTELVKKLMVKLIGLKIEKN